MFDVLRSMLSGAGSAYADIRYEIKTETVITMSGRELTRLGSNTTDGYVLRVLHGSGFSSIAFTKPEYAEKAMKTAIENAGLLGSVRNKPVGFAPSVRVTDTRFPKLIEDPHGVTIEEKLGLVRKYNNIPYRSEKVVHTNCGYAETTREKYFASTEGTEIRENLVTVRMGGNITAREDIAACVAHWREDFR